MRDQCNDLEKEIDLLKAQKAECWREISRLKETNDLRVRESADQGEKLKAIDYDLSRSEARIEDTQKLIDARNYDLRNKQILQEDTQREIQRLKEQNSRIIGDN